MKRKTIATAALAAMLLATSAGAELRHVEIKTLGMDWEICAHAVRVAMQKVDGVQSVRVSLNDGLTILDLKPENAVTLVRLRQIIKNNGFVSKEASVLACGTPSGERGFVVSGTNEQLTLGAAPQQTGDDWRLTVLAAKP
jgi:copper chaperone CopZ